VKILAFGDSLTEGMFSNGQGFSPYTIKLEKLLNANLSGASRYDIVNEGISGQRVFDEMSARLPQSLRVHSVNLKLVIILGGTNDLSRLDCENSVNLADEIIKLHAMAHKRGYRSVVVTIPEADMSGMQLLCSYDTYQSIWYTTNEQLRQYAAENTQKTVLCDLAECFPMFSLNAEQRNLYWSDNLHPSKAGYERMAEILYKTISMMKL